MKFSLFSPHVNTLGPEEARRWMAERPEESYTLLDVRESAEYEVGHIPGATLIPVSRLPDRLGELATGRPVLAY